MSHEGTPFLDKELVVYIESACKRCNITPDLLKKMMTGDTPALLAGVLQGTHRLSLINPMFPWTEGIDTITCSLVSDGTIGPQWKERLARKAFIINDGAERRLIPRLFGPVTNGIEHKIVVLKGSFWREHERKLEVIKEEAKRRELVMASPEVACLFREKFSDESLRRMGFWTVAFPIGEDELFFIDRYNGNHFRTYFDCWDSYDGTYGFAFLDPSATM